MTTSATVIRRAQSPAGSPQSPAGLLDKRMFALFPIPMFMGIIPNEWILEPIENEIRALKGDHRRPWMSADDLHRLPVMRPLIDLILTEAGSVLDFLAVERASHYVSNMWANVTAANHRGELHVHPNSLLSGLVYIKAPPNCSPTLFVSPRRFNKGLEPRYTKKNEYNSDFMLMPAVKGRMLIWPSHLPHAAEHDVGVSTEDRIVVSFNVMIRACIDIPTARLNLT